MSKSQWEGLSNDELALIESVLPEESDLYQSVSEELQRRKDGER